jgi:FKBP-type peptidyl-prolyl cis-trans isomerase
MMMIYCTILYAAITAIVGVDGFVVVTSAAVNQNHQKPSAAGRLASSVLKASSEAEWVTLTDGVRKRVVEEGDGDVAQEGSEVEVEYVGTLVGEKDWTEQDVVDCWLTNQQGLDHLADAFIKAGINGNKLMNTDFFTEDFVTNELGVSNKKQCKKLVMAAKRIGKQQDDFAVGTEFDSSEERGPFKFTLGQGKVIKAYELAVATMKKGERAEIICRSDSAYGAEGYRKQNGDVVVPPFATLCFDINLLKC